MPSSCVIFAALGPNPAPLTELVWKLAHTGQFQGFEIHVVVEKSGRFYLDGEVLAPGGALHQLRAALGPKVTIEAPHVHEVRTSSDELLDDDADPESFRLYADSVWKAARTAVESAGERPVVFGLIAGRRRTMTALASSVFQLLARPKDRLVDVRVSDARVEGGTGFFFPEQEDHLVQAKRGDELVDVRQVDVILVEVDVPRLRAFVPERSFDTLGAAQAASQGFLEQSAPPQLEIRLSTGTALVDGEVLPLPPSLFVWFSYLAIGRELGDGWVPVRDLERLRSHLELASGHDYWDRIPAKSPLAKILNGGADSEDRLATPRAKTRKVLQRFCGGRRAALQQIVPETHRRQLSGDTASFFQRIPLDPAFIKISD